MRNPWPGFRPAPTFTTNQAAGLLDVDTSLYRRWCREAGIVPKRDHWDERKRRITSVELCRLARLHGRVIDSSVLVWGLDGPDPEAEELHAAVEEVKRAIARLRDDLERRDPLIPDPSPN